MDKQENVTHAAPPVSRSICSLVVARDGLLALIVGGRERWRQVDGYTLIPAELPAQELDGEEAGDRLRQALAAIARRCLQ